MTVKPLSSQANQGLGNAELLSVVQGEPNASQDMEPSHAKPTRWTNNKLWRRLYGSLH